MYTTLKRSLLEIRYYVLNLLRQGLAPGGWFSLGTPVSSTNKTYRHDITAILLKVSLNAIALTRSHIKSSSG
jgi:hypothetical protein